MTHSGLSLPITTGFSSEVILRHRVDATVERRITERLG